MDLVPSVPPANFGYEHAGCGVHMPRAAGRAAKELEGVSYERDPAELADAVATGRGGKHHMMTSYRAALQAATEARSNGLDGDEPPPAGELTGWVCAARCTASRPRTATRRRWPRES